MFAVDLNRILADATASAFAGGLCSPVVCYMNFPFLKNNRTFPFS